MCSYLRGVLGLDVDRVEQVRRDLDRICADLTLVSSWKQDRISLLTRGPRFPLVPGGDAALLDAQGIHQLLRTLFVGVKHSENKRGISFESEMRAELERRNLKLIQRRYEFPEGLREVDAAVRAGTTLWLIEAHSMERPLDFEIGKPSVVIQRSERLAGKLDQVASIRETPFVEWIWTREERPWINSDVPRVLSASELMEMLTKQRNAPSD